MYKLADIFFLKLYFPNRQLTIPLSLFCIYVMAYGLTLVYDHTRKSRWTLAAIGFLFLGQWVLTTKREIISQVSQLNEWRRADLHAYLSILPKDSTIATDVELADAIPCFSKRKVFVSESYSFPWFKGYTQIYEKRITDFYRAFYSSRGDDLWDFCRKNNIDYLVVNPILLTDDFINKGRFAPAPYNEKIASSINKTHSFFLNQIPSKKVLFKSHSGIYVLKVESGPFKESSKI